MLGTKNNLAKDTENEYIERVRTIYNEITQRLKVIYKEVYKSIEIKCKIFSDNIVIAIEKSDKEDELQKNFKTGIITELAAYFQLFSLENEILTRGVITIAPFIMDELMISGSGLVRAYELESRVAIFPRIIIDNEVAMNFVYSNYLASFINRDIDGMFYINLFAKMHRGFDCNTIVRSMQNIWTKCIYNVPFLEYNKAMCDPKPYKTDYNKLQKIYWLMTLYNDFCKTHPDNTKLIIGTQDDLTTLYAEGNSFV